MGYCKMTQKYGKTFSVQLGQENIIVSSDLNLINKVMKDKRMTGRPSFGKLDVVRYGNHKKSIQMKGILFSSGDDWSEQRRFSLQNLRDFGFGKSSMTEMIHEEVEKFKNVLRKDLGKPKSLSLIFNISVVNALWKIITGKTLELDDPKLKQIVKGLDDLVKNNSLSPLFLMLPIWLADIVPEGPMGLTETYALFDNVKALIKPLINEHEQNYDSDNINDFMDVYIDKLKTTNDPRSSFFGDLGEQHMMSSIIDLFFAGTETTSSTLLWAFFLLCIHPDVQEKMRQEMVDIVGTRKVELEDRHSLPYTEAVISEVHRWVSLVAFGLAHVALEDVEVDGILIPKGTLFQAHVFGVHHDPHHWNNPKEFNPERFLDQEGKYHSDPHLIPFLIGKRFCLGQALAQNELFMFITLLLQEFTFRFPPGVSPPVIKEFGYISPTVGLNQCPPYQVVIQPV